MSKTSFEPSWQQQQWWKLHAADKTSTILLVLFSCTNDVYPGISALSTFTSRAVCCLHVSFLPRKRKWWRPFLSLSESKISRIITMLELRKQLLKKALSIIEDWSWLAHSANPFMFVIRFGYDLLQQHHASRCTTDGNWNCVARQHGLGCEAHISHN